LISNPPSGVATTKDFLSAVDPDFICAMLKRFTILVCLATAALLAADPVEIIPREFRGASQPQIAVSSSGRVHVAFGKENGIYHTSSKDGKSFSTPVRIGDLEKPALGMRRGPRITATNDLVLVTAISHGDGNIHAWTSQDEGETWNKEQAVNTAQNSAREGLQAITGDGHGLVAAVWLDLRDKGTEVWARVSRDGGLKWDAETRVYASPDGHVCECCVPSVAISARGEIAVMWRNWLAGSRDMYLSTSSNGKDFSPAKKLGSGTWKLNGCPMDGGGLTFGLDGRWAAVWRRERDIFASDPNTPEKQIASGVVQPVSGYAGKSAVVLWEENGGLLFKSGTAEPSRFADGAKWASIASGPEVAYVAWEGTLNGEKTILLDHAP
jgi:hypothetical protein